MQTGIVRMTNANINKIDDSQPGGANSDATVPTTGLNPGQVGKIVRFGAGEVPFDSSVGTLYDGEFQYVQTKAGSTLAPAVGLVAYWDPASPNGYVVAPDAPTGTAEIAGIYINALTKGNYGFIQVSGEAVVKCKAALTRVAAAGQVGIANATEATVDNIDSNDTILGSTVGLEMGVFSEAPANGALKKFRLFGRQRKAA